VGQELLSSFPFYEDSALYYWIRESKNTNAEIDYLYQIGNKIFPVEVKAGKSGTLKSLHVYLTEKRENTGIRLNMDLPSTGKQLSANIQLKGEKTTLQYNLISLPLYMTNNLAEIISTLNIE